ncbi:MAG: hypothetical protein JSW39_24450 [Desulfobacterales bacterium]|nr:MAG: hypothetical protein JSW39_24450 [Desulfobacterales bacterium]
MGKIIRLEQIKNDFAERQKKELIDRIKRHTEELHQLLVAYRRWKLDIIVRDDE